MSPFFSARHVTVPLPVPLVADVIVSQPAFDLAVHAHPACVVTVIGLPSLPSAFTDSEVGEIE